eukprot:Gb_04044 [translate_table: standard]
MQTSFPSLAYRPLVANSYTSYAFRKGNAIHWLSRFRAQKQSGVSTLTVFCFPKDSGDEVSEQCSSNSGFNSDQDKGGLLRIAGIIGVATTASKILTMGFLNFIVASPPCNHPCSP